MFGSKAEKAYLHAGVPQGSVLGPLLFLVYINDISDDIQTPPYLFADDTSLFCPVLNGDIHSAVAQLNSDLGKVSEWAKKWLVKISESKTVAMLFSRKKYHAYNIPLKLGSSTIATVHEHKHLGLLFTTTLSWSMHIQTQVSRCNKLLGLMKRFKYRWSRRALETCYISYVRPVIEYCNIVYDGCTIADSNKI